MRLFRRTTRARELSDYRPVADAVHARRAVRKERPEARATSDELRDTARSYAPQERLRTVSDEVQQFQRDCEGMPRKWVKEETPRDPFIALVTMWVLITLGGACAIIVLIEEKLN